MNIKKKINQWEVAKEKLAHYKEIEANLRDELVNHFFPRASSGTHKKETPYGVFNCNVPKNYKIDSSSLKEATAHLTPTQRKALTKTEYKLVVKAYNELPEKQRNKFNECLTVTPGKPQLSFERYDTE